MSLSDQSVHKPNGCILEEDRQALINFGAGDKDGDSHNKLLELNTRLPITDVEPIMASFDGDGDGKLNWAEYRIYEKNKDYVSANNKCNFQKL